MSCLLLTEASGELRLLNDCNYRTKERVRMTRMSCKRKGPLVPICNDDKSTPSNNVQIGLMSNV